MNYTHITVNHSFHFIKPITFAHTQAIESYWSKIKYRIKIQKGIIECMLKKNSCEMMWKDNEYFPIKI